MKLHTVVPALLSAALAVLLPAAAGAGPKSGATVRSMSGGVGVDEAKSMREKSADYALGLTFASRSGQFIADVDVQVKDRAGRVVYAGFARGPIVLVDLPAGTYIVEATFNGQTLKRTVKLDEGRSRALTLNWPLMEERPVAEAPPIR